MSDDKDIQKLEKKKLKDGWIKSWMMIEALAVNKQAVDSALKKHIEKMEKEDKSIIIKKDFKEIKPGESPFQDVKEVFSGVVELEILTETFDRLFYMVVNYGPSSVEILEPEKIVIDMGEAQGVLNSMADIIHKFAAATMRGMLVDT